MREEEREGRRDGGRVEEKGCEKEGRRKGMRANKEEMKKMEADAQSIQKEVRKKRKKRRRGDDK